MQPHRSWLSRIRESEPGPVAPVNLVLRTAEGVSLQGCLHPPPPPARVPLSQGDRETFYSPCPTCGPASLVPCGEGVCPADREDSSADQLGAQVTQHLPVPVNLDRVVAGESELLPLGAAPVTMFLVWTSGLFALSLPFCTGGSGPAPCVSRGGSRARQGAWREAATLHCHGLLVRSVCAPGRFTQRRRES